MDQHEKLTKACEERLLAAIARDVARAEASRRLEREARREEYVARVLIIASAIGGLIVLAVALYKVAGGR